MQAQPKLLIDTKETKYGQLKILSAGNPYTGTIIEFQNKEIFNNSEDFLSLSFHSLFSTIGGEEVVIIQETAASAAFYRLISISDSTSYWVSDIFGTKSDLINVYLDTNDNLIIKMPDMNKSGDKTYIYKNRKIKIE